ncbi:MAG: DUF4350 domain-containing protein [Haloarculaceae archaeon]
MEPTDIAKPLGVFVAVIVVIVGGTAVAATAFGGGSPSVPDGQNVSGQSPGHYQPDAVNVEADPETGDIEVDAPEGEKKILIDTKHGTAVDGDSLEYVVEALTRAGHDVDIGAQTSSGSSDGGFGSTSGYNATLQQYDAVLVINPTQGFTKAERAGLREYTEGDGRLVVLGEPTQLSGGGGLFSGPTTVSFGANDLTGQYGARMGAEGIYNMDDDRNDNWFKSVYAEPAGSGTLTEGVDAVTFENAGYLVTSEGSDAEVVYTAADGTKTLETRRNGSYATVVRNDNMVFVADTDFMNKNEVYDADNEVFISNLLAFMVSGDKPEDVPETANDTDEDGGF